MFVTYPDVLQPGRGGLRAGWPLALLAASGAAISHAIPSEQLACSYHFVSLSHSCLGIACGFGEGGAHRGCGWGEEGVWVQREGCVWGRIEVWLGAHRVCGWGSPGVRMSAPGSFWGLDGTEVLCFRRCEEVRGCIDDRIRIFLALLDALGVTPVWKQPQRLIVEDVSSAAKFHIMICFQPLKKMKIAEKTCFHRLKPVGKTAIYCGNIA